MRFFATRDVPSHLNVTQEPHRIIRRKASHWFCTCHVLIAMNQIKEDIKTIATQLLEHQLSKQKRHVQDPHNIHRLFQLCIHY